MGKEIEGGFEMKKVDGRYVETLDMGYPKLYQGPLTESECAEYKFPECDDKNVLSFVYKLTHDSKEHEAAKSKLIGITAKLDNSIKHKDEYVQKLDDTRKELVQMYHDGSMFRHITPFQYFKDYMYVRKGVPCDAPSNPLENPETYFLNPHYTFLQSQKESLRIHLRDFYEDRGCIYDEDINIINEYNRQFCNSLVPRKSKIEVKNAHNVPLTLYGAIIGDMVGSPYEFPQKERIKTTDFEFFSKDSRFTDDTVCTIAIANAIADQVTVIGPITDNLINMCKVELISICRNYKVGYGGMFRNWLYDEYEDPAPYNSLGNGSAMRVAACGIAFDSLYDTLRAAECSAMPTHNHIDGIKGAQAVAEVMWRVRNGNTKDEIKRAIEFEYGYNLSRKLDEIRPDYKFDATCPGSVPESIIAFLEGNSFEECVRLAVSLGGDTDTQGAIAGAMASMMYRIPQNYIDEANKLLTYDLANQVHKFNNIFACN